MISDGTNVFWFILGHGVFSLSSSATPVVNTPDMNFPDNPEEFTIHGMSSCTLCVNMRSPSAQSLPGLRKSAWRASAAAQWCLPFIFCLPSSMPLLTSPSSFCLRNLASTDSTSKIEFSYFKINLLRQLSIYTRVSSK